MVISPFSFQIIFVFFFMFILLILLFFSLSKVLNVLEIFAQWHTNKAIHFRFKHSKHLFCVLGKAQGKNVWRIVLLSRLVVSDSAWPHRRQPTRLPPSLGFSRQEHWSGLPFPSPMHESESEVAQSYLTLRDPMDCSLPGSSVHGVFQARGLEWGASAFSNAWKWKVKVKSLSHIWLLETPWTAAYQAPPSMGYSRQEYWSGVSLPSPTQTSIGE